MPKMPKAKAIKTSRGFRLQANYEGQQYKRFLIPDGNIANQLQKQVNQRVIALRYGILTIPEGTDVADFLFCNLKDARKKPRKTEKKLKEICFSTPKNTQYFHLSHLMDKYLEIAKTQKPESSYKTTLVHIRHLKKFVVYKKWGNLPLKDIDIPFFDDYKAYRKSERVSENTINKELVTFHGMFELGKRYKYVSENVLLKVERYKRKKFVDRFRTIEEAEEILKLGGYSEEEIKKIKRYRYLTMPHIENVIQLAKGHWLQPLLIVFCYTGMRRGEVMQLEWKDVDFEKGILWAKSKKQSRSHESVARKIPMHEKVVKVLEEQKKGRQSRWVFPGPDGNMLKRSRMRVLSQLLKDTRYEGLGYHNFRHSFASVLAAKGIDGRVIDRLMGHTSGYEIRRHYEHLGSDKTEEAIKTLNL